MVSGLLFDELTEKESLLILILAASWFNVSDDMSDMDRTATMIPKRSQLQAVKVHQVCC